MNNNNNNNGNNNANNNGNFEPFIRNANRKKSSAFNL